MRIALKNLVKNYGSLHAVSDISLEIPQNRIFGIIGKSGAGKSTLVRMMSLLEKPDAGSVWFDDRRVDQLEKNELIAQRRKIGMIFQNFNLFSSRTAGMNVAYPLEICGISKQEIDAKVKSLMEIVGLGDRIDAPISTLSGGQKQRVAIARALANEPEILFCDEATSALDPQTTRAILDLIKSLQKKMNLTVVMITHQMEVVRDSCNFVAVLDEGRVVEQGAVTEIFSNPRSSVTKDFLAHLMSVASTEDAEAEKLVRWSSKGGRYTLRFRGGMTDTPVLSRLGRDLPVEVNIRAGGVQHVEGEEIGTIVCDISGVEENRKAAVKYLQEQGIVVEEADNE
ncbi:MAG: methionine ABC transporter ATP-binding protein [Sphaerochaetaceae bacterium]|jgi:D-methionine transport system ATP-binding protein|nr:methionine ABC transporter ATP-binding protein [Sphaerochaetaceae bacterium]MDD3163277.1 methionine ABC transporter ATP-binding protein [Sphaerochaetaceae bacterium]MDD4006841.1 methionine ABC transporter ATP-binding protein [Sphaerochaetaceae bacterium]MDD4395971.1 methionine ABC transporter ATP-binding protein [Sphaerochaetaceae bacterium]